MPPRVSQEYNNNATPIDNTTILVNDKVGGYLTLSTYEPLYVCGLKVGRYEEAFKCKRGLPLCL